MSILVLSAGRDPILLRTRNEIMGRLGCVVTPAINSAEVVNHFFDTDFDLIVLCHSIPPEERRRMLRLVKNYRPTMPAILVADNIDTSPAHDLPQFGVKVPPEPDALVRAIGQAFPQPSGPV